MVENLTFKKLFDVAEEQKESYKFITTNAEGDEIAVPFGKAVYAEDVSVFIVDKNYNIAVIPLHENPNKLPQDFMWAKDSFERTKSEWDQIEKSDAHSLIDNFRQRGGVVALVAGEADNTRLQNAIRKKAEKQPLDLKHAQNTPSAETGSSWVGGEMAILKSGQNMDFILSLSATKRDPTALLHELVHAADNGCSHSDFFKMCYMRDMFRGSKTVDDTYHTMIAQVRLGHYTQDNFSDDMLARLAERRYENPEQFKSECPFLDSFYGKVFYPALRAQTVITDKGEKVGNPEAHKYLQDLSSLSEKVVPLTETEKGRINSLYKQLRSEGINLDKERDIQSTLRALIDHSPSARSVFQVMDSFRAEMHGLEGKTISDHTVTLAKYKSQDITTGGFLKRLKNASEQQPMDNHNAIDYRDVGGKARQVELPKIPNKSPEEIRQQKREEIYQRMGLNNSLLNRRGNSI